MQVIFLPGPLDSLPLSCRLFRIRAAAIASPVEVEAIFSTNSPRPYPSSSSITV